MSAADQAHPSRPPSVGAGVGAGPWDIDPALKPKRLLLLAQLAIDTRNQALAEADRDAGDTNWGIGCKAHERFVHRVSRLAETTERSWLRVHRDGLSLVSVIEGVAVRAYHGDSDRPHARHVMAAQVELFNSAYAAGVDPRQLSLFAPIEPADGERWAWLMAVETDTEGRPVRVVFFQATASGETRSAWVAPTENVAKPVQESLPEVAGVAVPSPPAARQARRGLTGRRRGLSSGAIVQ
jgi:hypothetical protein